MSAEKTILLVEDNELIMEGNRRALAKAGYHIEMAVDLAAARASLARCVPNAIVLDILLPDGNGLDFIPEIRAATTAPVLLLTSLDEMDERLAGLRAGGDDYITKPYDIDELRERVAAFIRRDEMMEKRQPASRLVRGPLALDMVAQQAYLDGADMLLSPKEFALLLVLMQNEGRFVGSQALYEAVWKLPANDDTRAVKAHLSNLRGKLAGSGYGIASLRGEGYCFEKAKAE